MLSALVMKKHGYILDADYLHGELAPSSEFEHGLDLRE
jgi:hypothetical protein